MKIDLNQYVTDISYSDIIEKNVISCTNYDGYKTFLIRSSDNFVNTLSFENIYFLMKNNIQLSIDNEIIGIFHVLVCKKNDDDSVGHFIRVCNYLFVNENQCLSAEEMLKLFNSLEVIFKTVGSKDLSTEIGLYGELVLLNFMYKNNNDLYKKWHTEFFSKHDMEVDEKVKIEVKTTTKDIRKHSFSYDQLYRPHLKIYVASIMLKPVEIGLSLYELCNITMPLLNSDQIINLEIMMKKLNLSDNYVGLNCVLEECFDSIRFYDSSFIPKIIDLPNGVSNVHYDVDFSNIKYITINEIIWE